MEPYKHRRIGGRKGKMRLAHHILWENKYGPIPEGYQIHHIDMNRSNNDLENLVLLTVSDHQKIHSEFYAKWDGAWVRICKYCKEISTEPRIRPICDPCRARMARIERRGKNERSS